ncbi:hypothetical protein [Methanobrevibacter sp.]
MEIGIDKIGSKEYYGEVLSVMSNYAKLVKNPNQKIRPLTAQAIILTVISLVFLVIFTILYIQDQSYALYFYVVLIFAVAFILGIIYYILINRRISNLKNISGDRKLIIEDDFVEMNVGDEKTRLEISQIKYVIINKYSISFLPQNNSLKLIAVSVDYKEEILKAIKDKNIVVDNSNLY